MTQVSRQFDLLRKGRIPPHQSHSETSRAAAKRILPKVGTLRRQVYDFIESTGLIGATDEEIQVALHMNGNTARPRRRELQKSRLILGLGRRQTLSGREAVVWMVANPTQRTLM